MSVKKPVVLIVLDGWGLCTEQNGNAILLAKTPAFDSLISKYPYGVLDASGLAVGLPWGEVGNSEVGHLNLGAGTVLFQNLPRINLSIEDKSFFSNEAFLAACEHTRQNDSSLHIMGLTSTGGVHSHLDHLKALIELAKQQKIKKLFIHAFSDGRDTQAKAGLGFIQDIIKTCKDLKTGQLATIIGRYWAMDRNNAWDRTQKAYEAMTLGQGEKTTDPLKTIQAAYDNGSDDEMLEPIVITDKKSNPIATINNNDAVIFFNFREDRARQITRPFIEGKFEFFPRENKLENIFFVSMTEYASDIKTRVAFDPEHVKKPFGLMLSDCGLRQLRIAETEKYAHVTYFFNGGNEEPYKNEDHILVSSPKVKTYDLKPEMSAFDVTKKLLAEISSGKHDFILVNYANPDMVGHTGNLAATIQAVEAVDKCLGEVTKLVAEKGGICLITADHGNAEVMINPVTGAIDKEHSTNPVPIILVDDDRKIEKPKELIEMQKMQINSSGILADISLTVMELLNITPPPDMTGKSLTNDLN